ncbi:hypothetical protein HCN44_010887 [Aphidius gifuensis]|uniref:Uncharacterized protein n=1 Tax=Aphidius gifuensis TaxID=684658 RepID=A0A834XQB2_APHGI|nr:hypothetical protein HCN44_010887 [Aphidius gifuensis]
MLTGRHQRFLCEKILDIEIRAYPDLLITPKRFIELTGMIKELFPTESEQTYYIPYTPATANSKKVGAKGKFVEIYQQYRGIAIECGVTYKKKGAKPKSVNNTGVVRLGRLDDVSEEPDDDCKEKLELLHTCIDPPEVVKHYWTVTSRVRIKELVTNQGLETFDYYSQYPALAHKNLGVDLINIDFEAIYPDKESLLSEKYTLFEKQILSYYSRIKKKNE